MAVLEGRLVVRVIGLVLAGQLASAGPRIPPESAQSVMWGSNIPDGTATVVGADDYRVESANRSWSARKAVEFPELTRFELQHGDTWSEDRGRKPPKERCEFDGWKLFDERSEIWISYSMLIEGGPVSTAKSVLLGQFHHVDTDVATTAPYAVWLNPGDRLSIETWASPEDPLVHNPMGPSKTVFSRRSIERGRWYHFVHRVRFGHDGSGSAQVWIDGIEVANYSGPLGYVGKYYWKFGIYRESAPEPLAVQYANMEIGQDPLAMRIARPKQVYMDSSSGELPQLPLPPGAKLVALGDSIVRINHQELDATAVSTTGVGQLVWARALDPRFRFETWAVAPDPVDDRGFDGANQGLDGDHAVAVRGGVPGVLSRVPYALARKPAIVFLQVGTNDINSHDSAASVEAHLDQILARLRAANVWVVLSTIWPRVTSGGVAPWPARDPRWRARNAVNDWINSQTGRDGVRIVDPNPRLVDPSAPSGEEEWLPGYSTDGVHPAPSAAYQAALAINSVLAGMISPGSTFDPDPRAANLLDGTLAGTTGMGANGVAGTIAANWTATVTGGYRGIAASSMIEASKEANAGGAEKQVFVIRPVNDASPNSYHTLDFTYDPEISLADGGVAEGDWIEAAIFVEVSAWSAWVDISLELLLRDGWKSKGRADAMLPRDRDAQRWPTAAWKGWLLTEPVRIPAGANVDTIRTSLSFVRIEFLKGASGTGTVKLSRPIVRKRLDPRPDWNLTSADPRQGK
jgi:lysophospholipase L1-like esterase